VTSGLVIFVNHKDAAKLELLFSNEFYEFGHTQSSSKAQTFVKQTSFRIILCCAA
jgi:hypothetical protein